MRHSRRDQIEVLLTIHNRRLQKLMEQRDLYGVSVDPRILLEIEDIESESKKLQMKLNEIEAIASSHLPRKGILSHQNNLN